MPEPILGAAAETLLKTLGEGIYLVDRDRKIVFWNAAAERITGFSAAEVLGRRCADNILIHVDEAGRELCTGCCPLAATLNDGQPRRSTVFLNHREGHRVAVQVQTLRLALEDGSVVGVEVFTETGSREALLEQIGELQRLSLADPLTGLPNRRQMESVIAARSAAMRRNGIPFGVLFVDIDRFKAVNDRFGHIAGDKVLVTVAKTLLSSVRPFDTVGRWGGRGISRGFPGHLPLKPQRHCRKAEKPRSRITHGLRGPQHIGNGLHRGHHGPSRRRRGIGYSQGRRPDVPGQEHWQEPGRPGLTLTKKRTGRILRFCRGCRKTV
jgi:PAS domain S-box-containing protein